MTDYFECMQCKAVTPVLLRPPKCGQCGSGTGIISTKVPEELGKSEGVGAQVGGGDSVKYSPKQ